MLKGVVDFVSNQRAMKLINDYIESMEENND
jgi:hypothetical protein